jgi:radical SAM superfamily enzyme YgiQ (UPF0313 family)
LTLDKLIRTQEGFIGDDYVSCKHRKAPFAAYCRYCGIPYLFEKYRWLPIDKIAEQEQEKKERGGRE